MTTYYSCPHLPTCSRNIKYNKKPCAQHSRLNITRVKAHTLNRKIHGNCGPDCPTYKLDAQGVDIMNFQPFPLTTVLVAQLSSHAPEAWFQIRSKNLMMSKNHACWPDFTFLLRVITYGSLVGTWSRSFFFLAPGQPRSEV
ncbi:hypothetical protein H4Q26_017374 [Puccinia striiformis f. sp. tritici PST-130]|nr:hypothetical protein H4Q26_017374 [Puccinia striiformis f. sp. tritici PST-130]